MHLPLCVLMFFECVCVWGGVIKVIQHFFFLSHGDKKSLMRWFTDLLIFKEERSVRTCKNIDCVHHLFTPINNKQLKCNLHDLANDKLNCNH